MTNKSSKKVKLLAVASAGGHWKELMLLSDSFVGCEVSYVSTMQGLTDDQICSNFYIVRDSNQHAKIEVLFSFFQLLRVFVEVRPNAVITTGASPGALCVILGKIFRCKTIWVDSIANSEELSIGGKIARRFADITLTQWEHLADGELILYRGSVF